MRSILAIVCFLFLVELIHKTLGISERTAIYAIAIAGIAFIVRPRHRHEL